jgi:nucleoside-diphosphate-sugar epimerase
MSGIFLTGSSGFVGQNLVTAINSKVPIRKYSKGDEFTITENIIIHLAGKAHDLKKAANSDEYYRINTELTKDVFDAFLLSNAKVFITLSSVKAVADEVEGELTENKKPNPITHYGKSKLLAEKYIFSREIPKEKRVYVLRPCMIHGPGNKGNLNLLFKIVSRGIPWPLGYFENKRSFCSIDNLMFIINELIEREDIPSGIYNVADDELVSTNELIELIALSQNMKPKIWHFSKSLIERFAVIGDILHLPLNSERLHKLTSSYIVNNEMIKHAIGKPFPVSSRDGLLKTFKSFHN